MTYIPANFDAAIESQPAPTGRYDLQITECKETKSGPNSKVPGSPQFQVSIGFTGRENTPNITQFISLPNGQETDGGVFKVLLLKRFLELFNVTYDKAGIDTEKLGMEMVGASVNAEVKQEEPDDNGNIYNRLVVPRLRGEAVQAGRASPPKKR